MVEKKTKEAIQNAALNPTVAPRIVLSNLAKDILNDPELADEGIALLKNKKSIVRNVQRKR